MPRALSILMATGLFLLAGCTGRPEGVAPVTGFELERYLGTWYEVRRLDHSFEEGLDNVTAEYSRNPDGSLKVINRGLNRETCEWDQAEARARLLEGPSVASFGVTFQWPFEGGYHVIALDREAYQYAMVSGPSRDYLWILARTPELAPEIEEELIARARALDYPVDDLLTVDQSPPDC